MRLQISEIAKISGVSVRTLHYYDEIGLLLPSETTEAGYRYYDNIALERLQQILFFRELDFSLKEILKIFSHPNYDKSQALNRQKQLLKLKKERLERLIELVDENLKGVNSMSFKEFDMTEIEKAKEKYAEETKERWGDTDAYKESKARTASYGKDDWAQISANSDKIMAGFAKLVNTNSESEDAQELVKEWQKFITQSFYECTNDILKGLGEMYFADERFKRNIDKFGYGTAEFMSKAIKVYCSKR